MTVNLYQKNGDQEDHRARPAARVSLYRITNPSAHSAAVKTKSRIDIFVEKGKCHLRLTLAYAILTRQTHANFSPIALASALHLDPGVGVDSKPLVMLRQP